VDMPVTTGWVGERKRWEEVDQRQSSGSGICGVVVFLVRIEQAPAGHWNVTPVIGAGIAAAGNQIVTTVLITYAVDCYPDEAGSIGVFITFVRQIWGFIGPFW
jgi:hypothetical protein